MRLAFIDEGDYGINPQHIMIPDGMDLSKELVVFNEWMKNHRNPEVQKYNADMLKAARTFDEQEAYRKAMPIPDELMIYGFPEWLLKMRLCREPTPDELIQFSV